MEFKIKTTVVLFISYILPIVLMSSCSENGDIMKDANDYSLNYYRFLNEGDDITTVNFYYQAVNNKSDSSLKNSNNIYSENNTIQDLTDFIFSIKVDTGTSNYKWGDAALKKEIEIKLTEYLDSKSEFIKIDNNRHGEMSENQSYQQFLTAYIDGEVLITCDQPLFGTKPGENLLPFMRTINNHTCQPYGVTEPYSIYHQDEIERLSADKILCNESWLRYEYLLKFKDSPKEMYDEITFNLTIPIIKEHARRYVGALITNLDLGEQYENVVFNTSTKISFDHK